jgi:hypothetical protein
MKPKQKEEKLKSNLKERTNPEIKMKCLEMEKKMKQISWITNFDEVNGGNGCWTCWWATFDEVNGGNGCWWATFDEANGGNGCWWTACLKINFLEISKLC